MSYRIVRLACATAVAAGSLAAAACGANDATKSKLEAAADSMVKQRDSTVSHMDSAGVYHDSTNPAGARQALMHPDTTKLGAAKTESTLAAMRKKTHAKP